jgi:hypothetical protein
MTGRMCRPEMLIMNAMLFFGRSGSKLAQWMKSPLPQIRYRPLMPVSAARRTCPVLA